MSHSSLQTHFAMVGRTSVRAVLSPRGILTTTAKADGATSGLREEYCIVIPPWLGTTWPQLRSILRRCDLRPRQLITEPEACLAFYLNGRNPAVIKKGDSLLSCQMEEEMTVSLPLTSRDLLTIHWKTFAHYTVTQISQAAKKGPGSTRSRLCRNRRKVCSYCEGEIALVSPGNGTRCRDGL
jgi:hypothetical protein